MTINSTILFNVQPWNHQLFHLIARELCAENSCYISNFPSLDESTVFARYQRASACNYNCPTESLFSDDELLSIIIRCRLLRELPFIKARHHVNWLSHYMHSYLLDNSPSAVVSEIRDQFFHDILFRLCDKLGIKVIGLVPSMIKGYSRITFDGSSVKIRPSVDDKEIFKVQSLLTKDSYSAPYLPKQNNLTLLFIKNKALNLLRLFYFIAVRFSTRHRYVYHYWAGLINLRRNVLDYHILPPKFDSVSFKANSSHTRRFKIYIPLHYYPEATTDYWCDVTNSVLYPERLESLIRQLSPFFDLFIKEHPSSIGHRKRSFYKAYKQPGVFFIPPTINSRHILNLCDSALIWSGSVGIEAIIAGKPILYATNTPYYDCLNSGYNLPNIVDPLLIEQYINNYEPILTQSPSNHYRFFKHLLQCTVPAHFRNDGSFVSSNKKHIDEAKKLAKYISSELVLSL